MQIRTDFPFDLTVAENICVLMPEGTRPAGRLWQPKEAGPVPLILEYLPCRKRDGTRGRNERMRRYLSGHGDPCLRLDVRGTGESEGTIDDKHAMHEQLDGVAAIDWVSRAFGALGRW